MTRIRHERKVGRKELTVVKEHEVGEHCSICEGSGRDKDVESRSSS
jgi:hypothetical protein